MQRINVNVRPASGYVFTDTDKSTHSAGSWKLVIEKVTAYRERQGKNTETTEREVMAQACERYPSLCKPVSARPETVTGVPASTPARAQPAMSIKGHVLMWLARLLKSKQDGTPLEYVSPAEAASRASICAACPFNVPFIIPGCGSCKLISDEYRGALITNRVRHDKLGACLLLGVDLVTSVNLDEVRVVNSSLPTNCWRKISI